VEWNVPDRFRVSHQTLVLRSRRKVGTLRL